MAVKWISSRFPGVRFYEHDTRKHGVRLDRYFAIRAQANGKRREEGLGWASEGWTEQKAATVLSELKKAHATGEGAHSLAEKREQATAAREAERADQERQAREGLTFSQTWEQYYPVAKANKTVRTQNKEDQCFRLWIEPAIGNKALKDIAPIHLERIKKTMAEVGRKPQTVRHVLAVIRQVFNFAKQYGLFQGDNVASKVKIPTSDAKRLRFLSPDEADRLLEALAQRSPDVHDMALLSLYCGLRAGEVFALTWGDVDFANGVLTLRDTKSGKTRQAPMPENARAVLANRTTGEHGALIFPSKGDARVQAISNSFRNAVKEIGLNNGVTDSRQKVVFHTLRHTFASWLVQNGVPLITVGRLLGHSTMAMTERYSHLAPDHFRQALNTLEAVRAKKPGKVVSINGST